MATWPHLFGYSEAASLMHGQSTKRLLCTFLFCIWRHAAPLAAVALHQWQRLHAQRLWPVEDQAGRQRRVQNIHPCQAAPEIGATGRHPPAARRTLSCKVIHCNKEYVHCLGYGYSKTNSPST